MDYGPSCLLGTYERVELGRIPAGWNTDPEANRDWTAAMLKVLDRAEAINVNC